MQKFLINLINFYQVFLSFDKGILAFFTPGGACKYEVSCSEYTKGMVREFGVFKGSWLGIKRVWGCR